MLPETHKGLINPLRVSDVTLNYLMRGTIEFCVTSSLVVLWRSTTESKNIVKPLAISQTIHTVCCEDDYFPKGKFKLFSSLFHSLYPVFPKSLYSVADLFALRDLLVVCNEEKCCVGVMWHSPRKTLASLGLFPWLVYVHAYCVPIATLNQGKRTRLLYLVGARIINSSARLEYNIVTTSLYISEYVNQHNCS